MIFSTYWFLIFLPAVLGLYYLGRFYYVKSCVLAFASLVFYYHFTGPEGIIPIAVLGVATYFIGLSKNKWLLYFGMFACVLSLIFYKYLLFLALSINKFLPSGSLIEVSSYSNIIAPLAISFFTFEFIHYLYDVKVGAKPIKSPLDFLHFAMFFPTLAAGPIKRFESFLPSLHGALKSTSIPYHSFQYGLIRFLTGFIKKIAADSLALYVGSECLGSSFLDCTLQYRWIVFASIAFRIYLDFSGYSDMAIGVAAMLGIKVPENFNWPYLSTSLTEFWRRWHISLSSWIRDYLYIPLGGNRVSAPRHAANLLIVFLICGLWHGASWNFIAWGGYHGIGLVFEGFLVWLIGLWLPTFQRKFLTCLPASITKASEYLMIALRWVLTTFFVWTGWLLFFYSPDQAWLMFLGLLGQRP